MGKLIKKLKKRSKKMFMSKQSKKSVHPYAWLAVFSLAAAGVVTIAKKSSQFISEKACSMKDMMKSKAKDMGSMISKNVDDMMN